MKAASDSLIINPAPDPMSDSRFRSGTFGDERRAGGRARAYPRSPLPFGRRQGATWGAAGQGCHRWWGGWGGRRAGLSTAMSEEFVMRPKANRYVFDTAIRVKDGNLIVTDPLSRRFCFPLADRDGPRQVPA